MGQKRKWEEAKSSDQQTQSAPIINRPKAGTKAFVSGKAVRDGLATNSAQAFVSFRQQIVTPQSTLPLAISHPTVVILQHYLDVSPTCEDIFKTWQLGHESKNESQTHAAVELLSEIIQILTPIPFFRTSVLGLVNKIIAPTENYHDYLTRLVSSGRRDDVYHGLLLCGACINVDPPSPSPSNSSSGRLGLKIWALLVEGGAVRGMGKQLGMRRRNKEGMVAYGEGDPQDKPDIRHLALRVILPLLSTSALHAHARIILPALYSGLAADPPTTVYRVLTALWNAISGQTPGLSRKTSLVLFQEKSIEHLWQLLSREDKEPSTGTSVAEMVSAFLEGITSTPGKGVCFPDEGWYPRRVVDSQTGLEVQADQNTPEAMREDERYRKGLHNRILANVVRKVGNKVVDDDGLVGQWIVKVFKACPELVSGYWPHSALAVDPRLNARWIATMAYIGRIISLPPPAMDTFRQPVSTGSDISLAPFRSQPPTLTVMVESILPSPLTKNHIMKGLQHPDTLVQHMTAVTLARGLQKLAAIQDLFREIEAKVGEEPSTSQENPWTTRRRELEMDIRKRIPELSVIIAFAQKAATLSPAEVETEEEIALAAKSAMLTEIALRLFGLCNKTLPFMASEMKFDIGRLLVSASSAGAERRARREAREGSVISDSGSVASIGTVGTAGMGGGFGQARGDVEGFEALSQLHVLQLLSEVKEWNWMNKAAGSQYTYLYHILLLRLSTRQPITYLKTTSLLHNILLPSLLYEHDPAELSIWLDALPRSSENVSGPMLLVQQIHLLSFLDDCFRRCIKTPYRYIEDSFALIPDFFAYTRPNEMISPVLMTVLEQLNAKILGQLTSTEAAGVILNYLRRVILALAGKQVEMKFLDVIVEKLGEMLDKAKEAGQARIGLNDLVDEIKGDLRMVKGKKNKSKSQDLKDIPRLLDEESWTKTSFERTLLSTSAELWSTETTNNLIERFIDAADDGTLLRRTRFILHLLSGAKSLLSLPAAIKGALSILDRALIRVHGKERDQLKQLIFENESIKGFYLTNGDDEYRIELANLNSHLKPSTAEDTALAQIIVVKCLESILEDKKAKNAQHNLELLAPWTKFVQPEQAKTALERLLKRVERLVDLHATDSSLLDTISALVCTTRDPTWALRHLTPIIQLKAIPAVINILSTASKDRTAHTDLAEMNIKKSTVQELLTTNSYEAYELLTTLVKISVRATKTISKVIPQKDLDPRLLPTIEIVLNTDLTAFPGISNTAFNILKDRSLSNDVRDSALRIITRLIQVGGQDTSAIVDYKLADFDIYLAKLSASLLPRAELRSASSHLLALALQWVTRLCSSDKDIAGDDSAGIETLTRAIESVEDVALSQELVEAVITAVIQDRLEVPVVVEFASLLATRREVKASFIRQQLQILFDSPAYGACTTLTPSAQIRESFTAILHSLFSASTYVSCQPTFIEPLLALYRGTMSIADRRILHLFQLFEGYKKLSVASILKQWSVTGLLGNNSNRRTLDALTGLDPGKVFITCQNYPLRRPLRVVGITLNSKEKGKDGQGEIYDPVFVMSLFVATLNEGGITGLDWVEILRSNVLGMTICGLSSRDKDLRLVASYTLAKAFSLIEKTPFLERPQLLYTLRLLRHSLTSSTTRLPTLTTLFFAHATRALANPSHFLYPLSSRFLLQRSVYDAEDVPMLYGMLYASDEGYKRERGWIIRLLRDGVKSEADWRAVRRRKTWSLLATLFSSAVDPMFRRGLLQAMESMVSIPAGARSLVLRDSLYFWLVIQWNNINHRISNQPKGVRSQTWERDEKNTLIGIADKATEHMCISALERVRDGKDVGEWIRGVETFVKVVLEESDIDSTRPGILSKIIYRLSTLPTKSTANLLPILVTTTSQMDIEEINALLFRAGLNISPENLNMEGVGTALAELRWRAESGRCGTEIGDWVRNEIRVVCWERDAVDE